jgi:hypothetical protein
MHHATTATPLAQNYLGQSHRDSYRPPGGDERTSHRQINSPEFVFKRRQRLSVDASYHGTFSEKLQHRRRRLRRITSGNPIAGSTHQASERDCMDLAAETCASLP